MDLRLVSLWLLLAYACGAWSRTTRNYPRIVPKQQQEQQQQRLSIQRRSDHLLQRPVRAISEFLETPPLPIVSHAQFPPSPSSYRLRKPNSSSSSSSSSSHNRAQGTWIPSPAAATWPPPPPRGKQTNTRNGRYARPQSADPGYLSNFVNWLNPFAPANVDAASKDAHAQDSSHLPQYAPHMPYTSGASPRYIQHGNEPAAPTEPFPRSTSTWTSGSSCNPCDVLPWTPVIRNDIFPYPSQYAANYGSNSYVAGPPTASRPLDTPGYSYSAPSSHSTVLESTPPPPPLPAQSQRDDYPHLLSEATPPLYQAGPGELPSSLLHQASSSSLDRHPHRQQQQQQQQHHHHHHQFQSQVQYNHGALATSNEHYNIHVEQSPIIDVEQAPFIEEEHPPPPPPPPPASHGLDYQEVAATDVGPIQPQYESSQHAQRVTKDSQQQDADPAESRPVFRVAGQAADSNERSRASGTSVHFQRSPLIELSVAGESAPTSSSSSSSSSSNRLPPARPKAKAQATAESSTVPPLRATLIDYIVSGPRETGSRRETKPPASTMNTIPTTTTTTTTTSTTTSRGTSTDASALDLAPDQKQQESHIETLVESYEFYKKKKSNRVKLNETMAAVAAAVKIGGSDGRMYSSENDESSASREAIAPSNSSDSAKKIIQIIIPYTSQYTPSPFHLTKSVSQERGDEQRPEETTPRQVQQQQMQQQNVGDNSIEDSTPIIHESRRITAVTVTRGPEPDLRNNHTGNSIDVHRLQKNIDNWTIQEFSKRTSANTSSINAIHPRWISWKQVPDEYLLANTAQEDSNEYYDFSHETPIHRRINQNQVTTTTRTTSTEPTTSRVKVVNAIYPKSTKKPGYIAKSPSAAGSNNGEKEKVYVVTPVPNSLEVSSTVAKDQEGSSRSKTRRGKVKKQDSDGLEQAYQVLPQAVNNLAVLTNAPESAAPALWGIMEHEQIAASPNQPRWRSESDVLPEPASTPVLYAGHSKVTYFRTKVH